MDSNEKIKMDHAAGYLHENISKLNIRQTLMAAGYHEEYPLSSHFFRYNEYNLPETAIADFKQGTITTKKDNSLPSFFNDIRTQYRNENGPILLSPLTDKDLMEFKGYKETAPGVFTKTGEHPITLDYANGIVKTQNEYTLEEFILKNIDKFPATRTLSAKEDKIFEIVDNLLENAKKTEGIDRSKVKYTPAFEIPGWKNNAIINEALAEIGLRPTDMAGRSMGFGILEEDGKKPTIAFAAGGFTYDNVSLSTLGEDPKPANVIWSQSAYNKIDPRARAETHVFENIPEALAWMKVTKHDLAQPAYVVSTEGKFTKDVAEEITKNLGRTDIIVHYPTKEIQEKNQAFVDELNELHGCIAESGVDWIEKSRALGKAEAQEKSKVIASYLQSVVIWGRIDTGNPDLLPKEFVDYDGEVIPSRLEDEIYDLELFTGENLLVNETLRRDDLENQKENARNIADFERDYAGDGIQYTFQNGESLALYHNKDTAELQLGSVTNAGLHPEFSIKIDYSRPFSDNFCSLLEKAYDERPELLGEDQEQSRGRGV